MVSWSIPDVLYIYIYIYMWCSGLGGGDEEEREPHEFTRGAVGRARLDRVRGAVVLVDAADRSGAEAVAQIGGVEGPCR